MESVDGNLCFFLMRENMSGVQFIVHGGKRVINFRLEDKVTVGEIDFFLYLY